MTDDVKKYFVRFSCLEDHESLKGFYKENPHKNVCERNDELMKQLADNGSVVIIEDDKGKIVGASISYPLSREAGDFDTHLWTEVGTTRMVLNGYPGLFNLMIGIQLLRTYLVEPPADKYVCQVENPAVQGQIKKMGWRPFMPTQEIVDISDRTLSAEYSSGFDNWFNMGPEGLPVMAKLIRDVIDKPHIEHLKSGQKIILDFSKSKFFKVFEDEIRNLADRDFGDPDKPKPEASIAQNRQAWMRWYFK